MRLSIPTHNTAHCPFPRTPLRVTIPTHTTTHCPFPHTSQLAKEEVDDLLKGMDVTGNGLISYAEFIAGCLEKQNLVTEMKIREAFDFFDADGNGSISVGMGIGVGMYMEGIHGGMCGRVCLAVHVRGAYLG